MVLSGIQYGFSHPNDITVDSHNNIWVMNWKGNSFTFIPDGNPKAKPFVLSGIKYGFNFRYISMLTSLGWQKGIVYDHHNNIWMLNQRGNSVTVLEVGAKK